MSEIINKVKDILEAETYIDKHDGDEIGYEIFCNYDDCLSDSSLAKITKADNPREMFDDIMEEWRLDSEYYDYTELLKKIIHNLDDGEFDENEEEIVNWIQENVYWYMPEDHFNTEVCVCIALNTGDLDSDFTQCNILNWYGDQGYRDKEKPLSDVSPIRWLAQQQGKLEELEKAISLELDEYVKKYDDSKFSRFTMSTIQELENLPSHMACLTFLVKMPLFDYFKLVEKKEGKITLTKESECGLFDSWCGGGSVLEIELDKDVELPIDKIWRSWIDCKGSRAGGYGYDVSDVYGIDSSSWTGEVKFDDVE